MVKLLSQLGSTVPLDIPVCRQHKWQPVPVTPSPFCCDNHIHRMGFIKDYIILSLLPLYKHIFVF